PAPTSATTLNAIPSRDITRLAPFHDCFVLAVTWEIMLANSVSLGRCGMALVTRSQRMAAIGLTHPTEAFQAGLRGSALRNQESRWRRGRGCRSGFGFLARQREARR